MYVFCGCRAGVRTDKMHTRVTSVDSMVYFKIHILNITKACGMLKVLDILITLSRSFCKSTERSRGTWQKYLIILMGQTKLDLRKHVWKIHVLCING